MRPCRTDRACYDYQCRGQLIAPPCSLAPRASRSVARLDSEQCRALIEYPALWAYLRDLYQHRVFCPAVNFVHIRTIITAAIAGSIPAGSSRSAPTATSRRPWIAATFEA